MKVPGVCICVRTHFCSQFVCPYKIGHRNCCTLPRYTLDRASMSCNWNEQNLNLFMSINWRASLVPAAAVIPAPIAYIKVVAVSILRYTHVLFKHFYFFILIPHPRNIGVITAKMELYGRRCCFQAVYFKSSIAFSTFWRRCLFF